VEKTKNRFGPIFTGLVLTVALLVGAVYLILPRMTVTLESKSGGLIAGIIGEVKEDVVILYRPQAYMVNLEHIARIVPGNGKDSKIQEDAPERIRTLNRLIDHKTAAYNRFQHQARTYLKAGNYDALEAMAIDAWETSERTVTGDWLANAFYYGFTEDTGDRDVVAQQRRRSLIISWCEARPDSAYALTALLRATSELAYAHRGKGYNSTVANKDKDSFQKLNAEAREIASRLIKRDDLDSAMLHQLAAASSSVAPQYKGDPLSVFNIAERTAKLEPDYQHIYAGLVTKTLPRWGGSAQAMDSLLSIVMANLPAENRAETYFYMANTVLSNFGSKEYVKFNFDWDIISAGFESRTKRWPDFDLPRHQFAALAYLHGKHGVVRQQLETVHPGWNYVAESVWSYPEAVQEVKQWSLGGLSKKSKAADSQTNLITGLRAIGNADQAALMVYLQKGGDPDARDETGRTLLQHAVQNGHPNLTYALISAGADIHRTNSKGWQAVHYAAKGNGYKILEMLERAGAALDIPTNKGNTPLMLAANHTNRSGFSWLLNRLPHTVNNAGQKGYNPLLHVAYDGHDDLVAELLLIDGTDVDAKTLSGNTALHLAASRGNEGVVRLLLAAGANPGVLNKQGRSVLAMAERSGNRSLVGFLEKQGMVAVSGFSAQSFRRANAFEVEANERYTEGEWAEAARLYQKAVDEYPQSTSAYVGLAISFLMNEEPKKALASIETAISKDPENAENYYKAGRIAFVLGDKELYMSYFTRYAKMAPHTHNTKDLYERLPELAGL